MSEYQEKHEVSKLIGAPPGYESLIKGKIKFKIIFLFGFFRLDIKKVDN